MTVGTGVSQVCRVILEVAQEGWGAGEGHRGHQHHVVWCDSPRASQEAVPSHRARVAFLAAGSFLAWLFQHLI